MWELQCVRVAVCGSCGVGVRGVGVAMWGHCSVEALRFARVTCVEVAVCGSCSVWDVGFGGVRELQFWGCSVGGLQQIAVWVGCDVGGMR